MHHDGRTSKQVAAAGSCARDECGICWWCGATVMVHVPRRRMKVRYDQALACDFDGEYGSLALLDMRASIASEDELVHDLPLRIRPAMMLHSEATRESLRKEGQLVDGRSLMSRCCAASQRAECAAAERPLARPRRGWTSAQACQTTPGSRTTLHNQKQALVVADFHPPSGPSRWLHANSNSPVHRGRNTPTAATRSYLFCHHGAGRPLARLSGATKQALPQQWGGRSEAAAGDYLHGVSHMELVLQAQGCGRPISAELAAYVIDARHNRLSC